MAATHSVVLYDPKDTSAEVEGGGGLPGRLLRPHPGGVHALCQFYGWCDKHHLGLFEVTRTHIEL